MPVEDYGVGRRVRKDKEGLGVVGEPETESTSCEVGCGKKCVLCTGEDVEAKKKERTAVGNQMGGSWFRDNDHFRKLL